MILSDFPGTAVVLTTSRQGSGLGYRVVVNRDLRSASGDVLLGNEAEFTGF